MPKTTAQTHTPGPWRVVRTGLSHDLVVVTGPQSQSIAELTGYVGQNEESDARLIAAAPDLLKAALEALNCINVTSVRDSDPEPYRTAREVLRAAIAKAEGRE